MNGGWLTLLGILACVADACVQGGGMRPVLPASSPLPHAPSPLHVVLSPLAGEEPPVLPLPVPVPSCVTIPDPYHGTAEAVGAMLVPVGFKCLQLISDDLVSHLPSSCLSAFIVCLSLYSKQMADVNASLTAVGLMWSVADIIASPVMVIEGDEGGEREGSPSLPLPPAVFDRGGQPSAASLDADTDALWLQLVVQLRSLIYGKWSTVPGVAAVHPFQRVAACVEAVDASFLESPDCAVHPVGVPLYVLRALRLFSLRLFCAACCKLAPLVWVLVFVARLYLRFDFFALLQCRVSVSVPSLVDMYPC